LSQLPPPVGDSTPPPGAAPGGYAVGDAFNYGWRKFQQNLGPWLLACLIAILVVVLLWVVFIVIAGAIGLANTTTIETASGGTIYRTDTAGSLALTAVTILFTVLSALLGWIISAQFVRGALGVTQRGVIDVGIFFRKELLGPVIVAAFLLAVIQFALAVIGVVPLIGWLIQFIGSIVVAFFAQFYAYFVLDQQQAPLDSIKSSFSFVNQYLATIIVLFLASIVAIVIGALLCGIGLFIAIPVTVMAHAYTYRVLRGEPVAA
jgi:uncharacterized membrane protein